MDNDALNSMDQLQRPVLAILQRLHGLAPTAIEDRIGGGDARGCGRILAAHDADKDVDGGPGMAAGQGANFSKSLRHKLSRQQAEARDTLANTSEPLRVIPPTPRSRSNTPARAISDRPSSS